MAQFASSMLVMDLGVGGLALITLLSIHWFNQ